MSLFLTIRAQRILVLCFHSTRSWQAPKQGSEKPVKKTGSGLVPGHQLHAGLPDPGQGFYCERGPPNPATGAFGRLGWGSRPAGRARPLLKTQQAAAPGTPPSVRSAPAGLAFEGSRGASARDPAFCRAIDRASGSPRGTW